MALNSYQDARTYKAAALAQSALLLSAQETSFLRRAELTLRAAAANPSIANGSRDCVEALGTVLATRTAFTGAGVIGPGGTPICKVGRFDEIEPQILASLGQRHPRDSPDMRLMAAASPPAILSTVPVADATLVLIAPPLRLDASLLPPAIQGARAAIVTLEPLRPISAEIGPHGQDWLPAQLSLPGPSPRVVTLSGQGRDGARYLYAAAPVGSDVYALVAAPLDSLLDEERWQLAVSIALPLTMLLLCVATAWFAVDRLVLRWINALRRAAAAYGRGDLRARAPTPVRMPGEIRELAHAFNGMADAAEARAEDLETALQAKSRLLRELHHRVKNNFQVIASLLSLQKRAVGPREREILRYPEDRVQALATAYRVSYAAGDIGNVPVPRLAQEILDYIRQSATAPGALYSDIGCQNLEVDLDTAIPLALLIVETVIPLLDEARRTGRTVRVILRCEDSGDLTLLVSGPPTATTVSEEQKLSSRLALAFVHQIEGRLEVEDGDPQVVRVVIPGRRLHGAKDAEAQASPG